ncbi:unnamed protein product, partial [Polarella glacialis]
PGRAPDQPSCKSLQQQQQQQPPSTTHCDGEEEHDVWAQRRGRLEALQRRITPAAAQVQVSNPTAAEAMYDTWGAGATGGGAGAESSWAQRLVRLEG